MGPPRNLASSLLPRSAHNSELLDILDQPVSQEVFDYLTSITQHVVTVAERGASSLPTPPADSCSESASWDLPDLREFVVTVCVLSNVHMPTLVCAIVYINRLRAILPVKAIGMSFFQKSPYHEQTHNFVENRRAWDRTQDFPRISHNRLQICQ